MELSDSPYAAGTPEYSDWVKKVYIPAVSSERTKSDRAAYGAESIGGRYIDGMTHKPDGTLRDDVSDWVGRIMGTWSMNYNVEPEPFTQIFMPRRQTFTGPLTINDPELWKALTGSPSWGGPIEDLSRVDRRAQPKSRAERRTKVKQPTRPRRGPVKPNSARQCPRHGGPAETCKFCRR